MNKRKTVLLFFLVSTLFQSVTNMCVQVAYCFTVTPDCRGVIGLVNWQDGPPVEFRSVLFTNLVQVNQPQNLHALLFIFLVSVWMKLLLKAYHFQLFSYVEQLEYPTKVESLQIKVKRYLFYACGYLAYFSFLCKSI